MKKNTSDEENLNLVGTQIEYQSKEIIGSNFKINRLEVEIFLVIKEQIFERKT